LNDQTHAPGWRGPPRRTGPVISDNDTPAWLYWLERIAPTGCFVICALAVTIAAYAWTVDWLAGHLHG
jgi:hypothetical protein